MNTIWKSLFYSAGHQIGVNLGSDTCICIYLTFQRSVTGNITFGYRSSQNTSIPQLSMKPATWHTTQSHSKLQDTVHYGSESGWYLEASPHHYCHNKLTDIRLHVYCTPYFRLNFNLWHFIDNCKYRTTVKTNAGLELFFFLMIIWWTYPWWWHGDAETCRDSYYMTMYFVLKMCICWLVG
jgi:hypothetical protein